MFLLVLVTDSPCSGSEYRSFYQSGPISTLLPAQICCDVIILATCQTQYSHVSYQTSHLDGDYNSGCGGFLADFDCLFSQDDRCPSIVCQEGHRTGVGFVFELLLLDLEWLKCRHSTVQYPFNSPKSLFVTFHT
jgi:hypothetical protein